MSNVFAEPLYSGPFYKISHYYCLFRLGSVMSQYVLYAVRGERNSEKALSMLQIGADNVTHDKCVLVKDPFTLQSKKPGWLNGVPILADVRNFRIYKGTHCLSELRDTYLHSTSESQSEKIPQRSTETADGNIALPPDPRDVPQSTQNLPIPVVPVPISASASPSPYPSASPPQIASASASASPYPSAFSSEPAEPAEPAEPQSYRSPLTHPKAKNNMPEKEHEPSTLVLSALTPETSS